MYPVTVKQIVEASPSTDDKSNFVIDGSDVFNVRLLNYPKISLIYFSLLIWCSICEEVELLLWLSRTKIRYLFA